MDARKRFKRMIAYSGYQEQVYDKFQREITFQNTRMVITTSFIGTIVMFLLTIAGFFVDSVARVRPLYLTMTILFLLIYVISKKMGEKSSTISLLCNYAFLLAAFFFALGLDVIQQNPTATTVCVLLVALPLLIVDKPYREFLFFLAMALLFMMESYFIKQSPKASIDILNAVAFLMVGSFLGYKHNAMVLRNISGQNQLAQQRDTDTLTTLYNKGAIEKRAMAFLEQENVTAGMMVIDMDNFKFVNDTYGHHSGDEILAAIGKMLANMFRSTDMISRFGGDEFIVFLPMMSEREILKQKAQQILAGVAQVRLQADSAYRAHVCIGISVYPEDADNYDDLFHCADTAMYRVKKYGKNGFEIYRADEKKKILLVDDVEVNRAVLRAILEPEFSITEAADGGDAWETLQREPDFAVVITDLQMPQVDGVELVRRIRADTRFRELAVIANTQYGDGVQEEAVLNLGVDDFVYKPASPAAIHRRVKNVMKIRERM